VSELLCPLCLSTHLPLRSGNHVCPSIPKSSPTRKLFHSQRRQFSTSVPDRKSTSPQDLSIAARRYNRSNHLQTFTPSLPSTLVTGTSSPLVASASHIPGGGLQCGIIVIPRFLDTIITSTQTTPTPRRPIDNNSRSGSSHHARASEHHCPLLTVGTTIPPASPVVPGLDVPGLYQRSSDR
jgi:hypothetical protein